jgi:hypothetical protein
MAMTATYTPINEREIANLWLLFSYTGVHVSAFHAVLLPGYRIMGWEWAEKVVRAWRKP